jgi:hypothetical protein
LPPRGPRRDVGRAARAQANPVARRRVSPSFAVARESQPARHAGFTTQVRSPSPASSRAPTAAQTDSIFRLPLAR